MIDMIIIKAACPYCGRETCIEVDEARYARFRRGENINSALPELSASKRETLRNGVCAKCQGGSWAGWAEDEEKDFGNDDEER